ncbi:MAG: hypothetical protein RI567_00995 [Marinobacter sp.]|nr:hypothetical protein [Marinobacter sp.]
MHYTPRPSLVLLLFLTLIVLFPVNALAYDPDGFHDCILKNVKSGLGDEAILAIRKSCAYQNDTTIHGEVIREPISDAAIPKDSIFAALQDSPEFTYFSNVEIVNYIKSNKFPEWTYERVKAWLIETKADHVLHENE